MEAMKGPALVIQTGNADMFSKTLQSAKSVITIGYKPSLQIEFLSYSLSDNES